MGIGYKMGQILLDFISRCEIWQICLFIFSCNLISQGRNFRENKSPQKFGSAVETNKTQSRNVGIVKFSTVG